jgi:hypothetical protein
MPKKTKLSKEERKCLQIVCGDEAEIPMADGRKLMVENPIIVGYGLKAPTFNHNFEIRLAGTGFYIKEAKQK